MKYHLGRVLVAHTCNPNYSGGSQFETSPRQIVQEALSQKTHHKKDLASEWLKWYSAYLASVRL
jgi:hypothetical protein